MRLLKAPQAVTPLALFRFRVVSEVITRVARGEVRAMAVRHTAGLVHVGPDNSPRAVSIRSVYRWLAAYEAQGIAGLRDQPRPVASDGVLEPALVYFLVDQKTEDPRASVPQLLKRAVVAGLLREASEVDRTTAWRTLKRRGLSTRRLPKVQDQRRFTYAHRLQMVLCDGKHFRAGPQRAKRVALFFIDDATRYIPVVVVGTSETAELFLRGLHRLLLLVGRFDAAYIDNGSGFIAHDVLAVFANLGIAHIRGTKGYPQGRGKVERFNQRAEHDLLQYLARDGVDPDCTALELRIEHYLRSDYNVSAHGGLGGGQTPKGRFEADERPLKPYSDRDTLRQHFFVTIERRVTNDHIVSIGGRHWEVPRGLAQQVVRVRQDVFDPTHLLLEHEGRTLRLAEVDLVANARDRRARPAPSAPDTPTPNPGAALATAERDLAPITQPDGGFAVPQPED
jgi:transposase InsO family protein